MFGKLKEKLKSALSIFSKKTEEEAVEKEVEQVVEEKTEEVVAKPIKEEKKEKVVKKAVKETVVKKEEVIAEEPIEEENKEEELPEEITTEPETEEIPIPEKYNIAKQKYEPDLDKIEEIKEEVEDKEKKKEIIIEKKEDIKEETKPVVKEEPVKEEVIEPQPKKSFFGRFKEKISTKTISADKFEELFWELEVILLENNVSVEVIEKIKKDLEKELVDKPLPRDVLKKIEETLQRTLQEILSFAPIDLLEKAEEKKPLIIAFFGINGTGKTTSIAKLTHYFQKNNKSVVLAACDTFRAAAIQQLEEHANKLGVKIIKHDYGSDAAAVAFDAVKYAEKNDIDIVMIDTAGRLHSNVNLMGELEKIIRVVNPHLKIFVGESITGNDCIEQAKQFNQLVEMDGAILTKVDVDEKGGAPLSIAYTIKKPILFLGVGQNYEDLEVFDKDVILKRLGF